MKIKIVSVGKLKERGFLAAWDEYVKKLAGVGVEVESVEVSEERGEAEKCRREEGRRILERVGEEYVLLDKCGKDVTSEELGEELKRVGERSGRLTLVVGGSYGVSEEVWGGATVVLSLGRVTWPHQLFRVMLLEQMYRCVTIWKGKKYHK